MISVEFPLVPESLTAGFEAPEDTDLLYISGANYLICKLFADLRTAGYKLTQLEESDGQSMIDGLQAYQESLAAVIEAAIEAKPDPEL